MSRKRRLWLLLAASAALAVGGGYFHFRPSDRPAAGLADPGDAALVALGQQIYAAECAACHGARLEGQANWRSALPGGGRPAPPHDESGHTWHHPDELLFGITKHGGQAFSPAGYDNKMPSFGDRLSDREIWAALAYIKSRWPAQIRARQENLTARTQ